MGWFVSDPRQDALDSIAAARAAICKCVEEMGLANTQAKDEADAIAEEACAALDAAAGNVRAIG